MNKLITLAAAVVLAAAVGDAQALGGNGNGIGAAAPVVAADGTVLVFQPVADPEAATPGGTELVAVTPAGVVAWRATLGTGVHDLALAGNLVVFTQSATAGTGSGTGTPVAATSTVTALQLASGVEAWSTELDGLARSLAPAGDRIYVKVVEPSTAGASQGGTCSGNGGNGGNGGSGGSGGNGGNGGGQNGGNGGSGGGQGMNGTFSLVAIGLDGQVLWSLPLAQ
ncbi:MAG: hypothetical protein HY825_17205 [Acidobacteria bacterium]|nr:hypothetical protein [Acidobacteriota bacterium]